jgi:uracil-DNA glycosylase
MNTIFIGEAWGEHEARYGTPFVGPAGQEFYRMLHTAGWHQSPLTYNYISPMTMYSRWATFPHQLLSTFNAQTNDIETFFGKTDTDTTLPPRKFGARNLHVLNTYAADVHLLRAILRDARPNLIVPLGATACWALGLGASISKLRGYIHDTPWGKALPVHHPAAVLRNWSLRGPAVLDLIKARRESAFPEIRVPQREIWTEPTVSDLWHWWEEYGSRAEVLAFDIETLRQRLISEIGFASDPLHALHIPFVWQEGKTYRSWFSPADEVEAWKFVKHVCESPIPKIGQNVVQYDCYWMAKELNITVRNVIDDTMTLSHVWQPELGKSLQDLGALFLDERSWKSIRKDSQKEKAND